MLQSSSSLERSTSPSSAAIRHDAVAPGGSAAPATGEMKTLLQGILAILLTNLCEMGLPLMSFFFVGRLGDAVAVAGLGLGVSVCNITGLCLISGMGTGIDVLCSQAHGAKNIRMVGVVLIRGTLLSALLVFIPVGALWYNMARVLLFFAQQPEVAQMTGSFARAYMWGIIPYAVFQNLKKCLQTQGVATPIVKVTLLGAVANIAFHYITIVVMGMGVRGAGLALSLTWMFLVGTLILYTWFCRLAVEGCWSGLRSPEVFQDWPAYLAVCIPGLCSLCVEWISIEASIFMAGRLGPQQLATQVIILNAYVIFFQLALSINMGTSIRVGYLLGDGNPVKARQAAFCGVGLSLLAALITAGGLGLGRGEWPKLFGVPQDVVASVVKLAPVFVAVQMIDIVQNVCNGVLKGMGLVCLQAVAAVIGFWCVGIPLSTFLGLHSGWGVKGLWAGMAAAEAPLCLFYLYVIGTADWENCAQHARERVGGRPDFAPVDMEVNSSRGDLTVRSHSLHSNSSGGSDASTLAASWAGAWVADGGVEVGLIDYESGGVPMVRSISGG